MPMILFIGTLFRFLHIVRLFVLLIIRDSQRNELNEQRQDRKGNDWVQSVAFRRSGNWLHSSRAIQHFARTTGND